MRGTTQFSRDDEYLHRGSRAVVEWDECPRCGELKYSTAKLCRDCSVEYRAVKMKAKSLVRRAKRGEKFIVILTGADDEEKQATKTTTDSSDVRKVSDRMEVEL